MQESILSLLEEWSRDLEDSNVRYGQHRMSHNYVQNQLIISFLKTKIKAVKKARKNT